MEIMFCVLELLLVLSSKAKITVVFSSSNKGVVPGNVCKVVFKERVVASVNRAGHGQEHRGRLEPGLQEHGSMLKDLAEKRWESMEKERQENEVITLMK